MYVKDIASLRGQDVCEEETVEQILQELPTEEEIHNLVDQREQNLLAPEDALFRQGSESITMQLP